MLIQVRFTAISFKQRKYKLYLLRTMTNLFWCNHQLTYASDPECMFLQSAALLPEFCYHLWVLPAGQLQSHAMLDSSGHLGQSACTGDVPPSVGHVPAWPAHQMWSVTS